MITEWYFFGLGAAAGLALVVLILRFLLHAVWKVLFAWLPTPFAPVRQKLRRVSWPDVVVFTVILLSNVLFTAIDVRSLPALAKRSAQMSAINFVPVVLGARMTAVISACSVGLSLVGRIHRWFGWAAAAGALVHTATAAIIRTPSLRSASDLAAVTAASGLLVLLSTAFARVWRYGYEPFAHLHLLLSGVVILATYVHVPQSGYLRPPRLYLMAAVCLYGLMKVLRIAHLLYRSVRVRSPSCSAQIKPIIFCREGTADALLHDAVQVHVRLARPWKPRPGQYVYLNLPSVSRLSFLESHPFYISRWYEEAGCTYIVLIIQRREGFSRRLIQRYRETAGYRALLDGPYGQELRLDSYGTVLLFATGIGITGQIPYVAKLLEDYGRHEVKARRIKLFWEMDSELHTAWVKEAMDELLERDMDRILDIRLFIRGSFLSNATTLGDSKPLGQRITKTYSTMDCAKILSEELEARNGRTVVSQCVNDAVRKKISTAMSSRVADDVDVEDLEFRPFRPDHVTRETSSGSELVQEVI